MVRRIIVIEFRVLFSMFQLSRKARFIRIRILDLGTTQSLHKTGLMDEVDSTPDYEAHYKFINNSNNYPGKCNEIRNRIFESVDPKAVSVLLGAQRKTVSHYT